MTSKPPSVVIDTNVLISAGILPRSRLADVLVIVAGQFVMAQNEATWNELISPIERDKFDRYFGESGWIAYLSKLAQLVQFFEAVSDPRWPLQIPPPVATPNSPRQDGRIMTARG